MKNEIFFILALLGLTSCSTLQERCEKENEWEAYGSMKACLKIKSVEEDVSWLEYQDYRNKIKTKDKEETAYGSGWMNHYDE